MICSACNENKSRWLWVAIDCRPQPVCYDCALVRNLYCRVHNCITLDLDDGTLCPRCVDKLEIVSDIGRAQDAYDRISKQLSKVKIAKIVQWIALARNDKPISPLLSLWWAIVAKSQRTEEPIDRIIDVLANRRNLGPLVPFSKKIRAKDIAQLNPAQWVRMVNKSGWPISYAEAVWRSAVAKAKRESATLLEFFQELKIYQDTPAPADQELSP